MNTDNETNPDVLAWLLGDDEPGVRYLALRDLCDLAPDDAELLAARRLAHTQGPIAAVLEAMQPDGWWVRPGHGYNPKYRSAVWALILLAQLGAHPAEDERIGRACTYALNHTLTKAGQFTATGAPSGTIDCLQGNMCWALTALGCDEPRLEAAFDWMAATVTGAGIAPAEERDAALRYYAYKCGPCFACGVNGGLPCAWGAVKVMLAFGILPATRRTARIDAAITQGIDFLLGIDPVTATYPTRDQSKPSRNWWKFGFPVFYVADLLQLAEALTALGCGADPRLDTLLKLIRSKCDDHGRWALEYDYAGKSWAEFGPKRQPNKWVTLRALRVLAAARSQSQRAAPI